MRVLVTGANGHIGGHVVGLLQDEGHDVVAFIRPRADTRGLQRDRSSPEGGWVRGDIADEAQVARAAEGCDAIIHLAAAYSLTAAGEAIHKPQREGTVNVMRAAKRAGVKRVAFTSSAVVLGTTAEPVLRDERAWADDAHVPYTIAKRDSERSACRLADELGVEVVVLNPAIAWGPGDHRLTPSTKLLVNWLTGRAVTTPGGYGYVDVRDVALAHVRALTRGTPGQRHLLCAANFDYRELGTKLHTLFGMGPKHLDLPFPLLLGLTGALELVSRAIGHEPPATRALLRETHGRYGFFAGDKAAGALGFAYRPIDTTILDSVRWLVEQQRLPEQHCRRLIEALSPSH